MRKSIMIDMDEVIVSHRFNEFLEEFLGNVDYELLNSNYRQDLISGREEEFKNIYQDKNLYKNNNNKFIEPFPNCVDVIKKLNEVYDVYIVTSYVWKKDIFNASINLKNKNEYLEYFFPFLDNNNFIYISNKSLIRFDIGIDDRLKNMSNCDKKLLFTEFRNKNVTSEELNSNNGIRVNNWKEIEDILLKANM